jgi:hypothetical protein
MHNYRLSAALHGRSADVALASEESVDDALKEFDVGGNKRDAWLNGDGRLNEERQELYRRNFPVKLK